MHEEAVGSILSGDRWAAGEGLASTDVAYEENQSGRLEKTLRRGDHVSIIEGGEG